MAFTTGASGPSAQGIFHTTEGVRAATLVTGHVLMPQIHGKEKQLCPYRECQGRLLIGQTRSCVLSGQVHGRDQRDGAEGQSPKAVGSSAPRSGGRGLGGPNASALLRWVRAAQEAAAGAGVGEPSTEGGLGQGEPGRPGGAHWGSSPGVHPTLQIYKHFDKIEFIIFFLLRIVLLSMDLKQLTHPHPWKFSSKRCTVLHFPFGLRMHFELITRKV